MSAPPAIEEIAAVISKAREVAVEYYGLTGKPLGITGEVGEPEAARLLNLTLAPARTKGYDATDSNGRRLQIKSRSIPTGKRISSARVGSIVLTKPWDAVILVLMDGAFRPTKIYEADREALTVELTRPGSRARNDRGSLAVSQFKRAAKQVWTA